MLDVGTELFSFIFIKRVYSLTGTFIDMTANTGISGGVGKQSVKISNPFLVTLWINILK